MKIFPIYQEWRMRSVGKLVAFGEFFEEADQLLLRGRVQVESRFVQQKDGILVPLVGFCQKN